MRDRIAILHNLLQADGTLIAHIDDTELGYLLVLLDEVFGRKQKVNVVTFKQSSVSGPKAINPGLVSTANYLLLYCKDRSKWNPNRIFQVTNRDSRYSKIIVNKSEDHKDWRIVPLREKIAEDNSVAPKDLKKLFADKLEEKIETFVLENADAVVRTARVADKDVNESARAALQESRTMPDTVTHSAREDKSDYYFLNGEQLIFYSAKTREIDGQKRTAVAASNIWDDLLSNNLHKEGGISFKNGKKPEALLKRLLEFATQPGDLVLDSFLGSGTTAAVAHKMGRRWIGVELGEHCETHCLSRLKKIVDGEDQDGITKAVNWQGGGGFRYYRLAESLIKEDQWGREIINPDFNPELLAEAVCKIEGFKYSASQEFYWQHGFSSESDFIYVTTQTMTRPKLEELSAAVGENRSLLVCCAAFRIASDSFPNLTLKKIPKAVMHRCEWNKDDYSLQIENLPAAPKQEKQGELELG